MQQNTHVSRQVKIGNNVPRDVHIKLNHETL